MRTSIRTRLLVSFLAIAIAAAGGLSLYFIDQLEEYALRNLEARLDAEAQLMSAMLATAYTEDALSQGDAVLLPEDLVDLDQALDEVGPKVTTRLRVLDVLGSAVADSGGQAGVSYGMRPEVQSALAGEYGAYTRILEDERVALYVARPIMVDDQIVGAVYSSSTTFSIMTLLRDYRSQLLWAGLLFILVTVGATELLARWLSAPLLDLERGAQALAAGDHSTRVEPRGARETRMLASAFNDMGTEIEQVVTELKEEERRKAQFVSDVSHELRTPLTAIRGTAETLAEGGVDPDRTERFLGTIVREAERLGRLAEDLLVLERIEGATGQLPLGTVPIADIVDRAVESLTPLTSRRGVSVSVAGEAGDVLGDLDRLQQVFANLLDNGSRVTPSGGTIRVALSTDDTHVVVEISDEGPGIPPDDLPRLFERFFRSDPARQRSKGGAGLGLAIVKSIVDAHGGTVTAENPEAGGARFTVRLPRVGE